MIRRVTRRDFLAASAYGAALALNGCVHNREGEFMSTSWSASIETYRDEETGALVRRLTGGDAKDNVIYQTHPMWVRGMDYLVFNSDRSGNGMQPHLLETRSGVVRPISAEPVDDFVVARKSTAVYALRDDEVWRYDALDAFVSEAPSVRVGVWPKNVRHQGMLSLDAREDVLYGGATFEPDKQWGIVGLDLASGSWRNLVEVDFLVGHVQANPSIPGLIMFCWETGGDAPQRMWLVDATDGKARPFYKETYDEWVTHEVWWGPDRALFTIWPYDEAHKAQPHGVAVVQRATGDHHIVYEMPAWHTAGSPDGRWVMADDFDRNLWLIKPDTGERRLLTQGHNTHPAETHPHASFTPDSKGLVFTSSRFGTGDIFLVEIPKWESLPLA